MTDLFSVGPGTTSYTNTSYFGGGTDAGVSSYGTSYGGGYGAGSSVGNSGAYGAGTTTRTVTTNTTTTPVVDTQIVGREIVTALGTNTADGYFGGGQAAVTETTTAQANTAQDYGSGGFFGADGSQIVTTVQQNQYIQPSTATITETTKTFTPATTTYTNYTPPPAPTNYQSYTDYNDYGGGMYDYVEEPKPASYCNLRNILLSLLGLLLLGGLLGGLLWLLKYLRGFAKPSIPSGLIPDVQQLAPILPIAPNITTPVILPPTPPVITPPPVIIAPTPNFTTPIVTPSTITTVTPTINGQTTTVVIPPRFSSIYTTEQLNAALRAALAGGVLSNNGVFTQTLRNAFRKYYTNDAEYNRAMQAAFSVTQLPNFGLPAAGNVTIISSEPAPLTAADIQQLVFFRDNVGPINADTLAKLQLNQAQYQILLQRAFDTGLINRDQFTRLAFSNVVTTVTTAPAASTVVFQAPAAAGLTVIQPTPDVTIAGAPSAADLLLAAAAAAPAQQAIAAAPSAEDLLLAAAAAAPATTTTTIVGPATTQAAADAAAAAAAAAAAPALSSSDIQQLLAYVAASGNMTTDALSKLGLTSDQYSQMLQTALKSNLIDAGTLAKLSLPSAASSFFGSISNAVSGAFNKVLGRTSDAAASAASGAGSILDSASSSAGNLLGAASNEAGSLFNTISTDAGSLLNTISNAVTPNASGDQFRQLGQN